jgi:dTDP-4-dehydrorhamnose reductase
MSLRYVVTGSRGQLGRSFVRGLTEDGDDSLVAAFSHEELDISDRDAVASALGGLGSGKGDPPDVLVNAAAYNLVDLCESDGLADAERVNGEAPGILAEACERLGTRFVHVSTDYVLAGDATTPVPEDATPSPRSAYGRSKLLGEQNVQSASAQAMIVRTSWVFGPGKNFVGAILRQGRLRREGELEGPLRVVDDQRGCPTYSADLADGIRRLVAATSRGQGHGGVYHLSNVPDPKDDDAPTWWDFARAILDARGYADLEIDRMTTDEIGAPAPRPAYSVLDGGRAASLGVGLRSWRDALDAYLASDDLDVTLEAAG